MALSTREITEFRDSVQQGSQVMTSGKRIGTVKYRDGHSVLVHWVDGMSGYVALKDLLPQEDGRAY